MVSGLRRGLVHHGDLDVEPLYFSECPSWYLAWERFAEVLHIAGHADQRIALVHYCEGS